MVDRFVKLHYTALAPEKRANRSFRTFSFRFSMPLESDPRFCFVSPCAHTGAHMAARRFSVGSLSKS